MGGLARDVSQFFECGDTDQEPVQPRVSGLGTKLPEAGTPRGEFASELVEESCQKKSREDDSDFLAGGVLSAFFGKTFAEMRVPRARDANNLMVAPIYYDIST
jgi:hypothetical protein